MNSRDPKQVFAAEGSPARGGNPIKNVEIRSNLRERSRVGKVLILLSTFNGARYLAEQIQSLLDQTHGEWELLIRDDGSSDGTEEIINAFCQQDSRCVWLRDQWGNIGVRRSFALLLDEGVRRGADFFMFCDQDDIWLPSKIEKSVAAMVSAGQSDLPLLAHCDLQIVGADLSVLHGSLHVHSDIKVSRKETDLFGHLCTQNVVTGCSMIINRSAAESSLPVPEGVHMHDWWIALVVAGLSGRIIHIDEALIQYRQHGDNAVGAVRRAGIATFISRENRLRSERSNSAFTASVRQIYALLGSPIFAKLPKPKAALVLDYIGLLETTRPWSPRRLLRYSRLGLKRFGRLRTLRLWVQVMSAESPPRGHQGFRR